MAHDYVDLATIHVPATGTVAPAAWGLQIRENFEVIINPPACSVFHSTTQSIPTATATVMSANSETFDNDGMHSTVTNNSRITAQTAGRYLFVATITFNAGTSGSYVGGALLVNGTTRLDGVAGNLLNATIGATVTVVRTVVLDVGEFVQAEAFQATGGSLAARLHEFAATYLTR